MVPAKWPGPWHWGLILFFWFSLQTDPEDNLKVIKSTINTCTGKNVEMWLALIYVSKGILLLYGLFLAYETRNVVYAHLNDSRIIGICVYNVVVLSTIGAFLALILKNEQYVESFSALSVCISFPATATISLIFIPKVKPDLFGHFQHIICYYWLFYISATLPRFQAPSALLLQSITDRENVSFPGHNLGYVTARKDAWSRGRPPDEFTQ